MTDFLNATILWISLFFMFLGLFSLVVPILPGLVIMWLAALAYGIVNGFNALGIVVMVIITILAISGSLADNLLMGVGAHKGGASWWTILVALLAGIAGTVIFPPLGGFIAAPAAIMLLETIRLGDWRKAWEALRGLATGFGLSLVVRFLLGVVVFGLWLVWVWKG